MRGLNRIECGSQVWSTRRLHLGRSHWILLTILLLVPSFFTSSGQVRGPMSSAQRVLERFCAADSSGKRLFAKGWDEIAEMFVTRKPFTDRGSVFVVEDYFVSEPHYASDGTVEFYVEYLRLGSLDEVGRFTPLRQPPYSAPMKIRVLYKLVFIREPSRRGVNQTGAGSASRARGWRIEPFQPNQSLTIASAIRHLEHRSQSSSDPSVKRTAMETIEILKKLN